MTRRGAMASLDQNRPYQEWGGIICTTVARRKKDATRLFLSEFPNDLSAQSFHVGCTNIQEWPNSAILVTTRPESVGHFRNAAPLRIVVQ